MKEAGRERKSEREPLQDLLGPNYKIEAHAHKVVIQSLIRGGSRPISALLASHLSQRWASSLTHLAGAWKVHSPHALHDQVVEALPAAEA